MTGYFSFTLLLTNTSPGLAVLYHLPPLVPSAYIQILELPETSQVLASPPSEE